MPRIKILQLSHKPTRSGKGVICGVKTVDKNGQEVWVNGWGNDTTKSWVIGQEVDLDIYQEEYNGTLRLKFKDVKQRNVFEELDKMNAKLDQLLAARAAAPVQKEYDGTALPHELPPKEEIKVEDIPF